MPRALFLDRDGVIVQERGAYTFLPAHVSYVPGIEGFLQQKQAEGFLLIVVSNQGGIAKGYYNHAHVYQLHQLIDQHLRYHGVSIQAWFYCPHHDHVSLCLCRKPSPLMLEKAIARYHIDPGASYMIGDKPSDAEAAKRAGVKPLQVASNTNLYQHPPF